MSDNDQTQVSTAADAGDAGYNKALKNRHIQMIAIGGSIGTGLFLGAGNRLAQGGPALPYNAYSSEDSPFTTFFSGIGVPHAGDIMQVVVLTAALSSLNAGLYATGRTLRSMALVGEGPRFASRLNKNHVPSGGIIITASLGPLGVLLNAFVPTKAFNIVMDLAGIGIARTWAMILISHLAFLRKVKRGEEQRPEFRMPGAPYTNYLALLFFTVVVASNVTSESGRWTLVLFAVVVILMVADWYYVRGRVGNLTDEAAASLQGDETLVTGE